MSNWKILNNGIHWHHTLSIAASMKHIDWHLEHLWDGGWKTIVEVSAIQHRAIHKRIGKPKLFRKK